MCPLATPLDRLGLARRRPLRLHNYHRSATLRNRGLRRVAGVDWAVLVFHLNWLLYTVGAYLLDVPLHLVFYGMRKFFTENLLHSFL